MKKYAADPVRRLFVKAAFNKYLPLSWCSEPNWGDALNPVLAALISGMPVRQTQPDYCDRYMAIGSILRSANSHAEVWGSGFIMDGDKVAEPPKAIYAVRGPLTRSALLGAGVECPDVYGDPALLLPRFYNPTIEKQYEIGIIPHYVDQCHPWIKKHRNSSRLLIIDVKTDIQSFVRAVKSCSVILSSSLHGLICADSYGLPNAWIQLSNGLIGGTFKFRDYRLSIGAGEPVRVVVAADTPIMAIVEVAKLHTLQIDLRKLLLACPFISDNLLDKINSRKPVSCGLPESLI